MDLHIFHPVKSIQLDLERNHHRLLVPIPHPLLVITPLYQHKKLQPLIRVRLWATKADNSSYDKPWTCPTCTLENPSNFLCCDVCAAERPPPTNTQPASTSTSGNTSNKPPRSVSRGSTKRSLPPDQPDDKKNPKDTFAFKNRTRAKDSLKKLDQGVNKKPLGWVCTSCSSFMETQWWTCSCCGTMKPYS